MKKILTIVKIDDYHYQLVDKNKNTINLVIEFHAYVPQIGDTIIIDDMLLREISNCYVAFGNLNDTSGRNIDKVDNLEMEVLKIKRGKNEVYLKRLYG